MVRHHAFFEALGAMEEQSPEWHAVFAGLSVLRLVDRIAVQRDSGAHSELTEAGTTRRSVERVDAGDPARAILGRIVDLLEAAPEVADQTGADLLSYGRALDLGARWPLAVDVFQTIAEVVSARQNPKLVIEACTALGAAARCTGDWPTSNHAYARAEHLAAEVGDRELALTVQVGLAGSQMIQGNLPGAEAELDDVLSEAGVGRFPSVEAIALHAMASVAHSRGDYKRAVNLAYRSLELTTNSSARERILADIAAAYAGLGMRDAARDGYTIVSVTSPHQWVRWQAVLNLMELAIDDADRSSFEHYLALVEGARLDPRLMAYYLFFRARGHRLFDLGDWQAEYAAAHKFADDHQLNQLAFEIDAARNAPAVSPPVDGAAQRPLSSAPSGDLKRIAEALLHLRESIPA